MDTKYIKYIIGGIAAFLLLQFVLVPLISRQKASFTVKKILTLWVENDVATAGKYFMDPEKTPPIYNLKSYKITSSRFDSVQGKARAQFWIVLDFHPDNVLPSGRTWICELTVDKAQWRASNFTLTQ